MTKQEELDKLYSVRTRLLCGESAEEVRKGGGDSHRTIRFTPPRLPDVESRIRELERELGINQGNARRPIGVHFG